MTHPIIFTHYAPGMWHTGDEVVQKSIGEINPDDDGSRDIMDTCGRDDDRIMRIIIAPLTHRIYHTQAVYDFMDRCDLSLTNAAEWNASPLGNYWVALLSHRTMRMARRFSRHLFNPPHDAKTA